MRHIWQSFLLVLLLCLSPLICQAKDFPHLTIMTEVWQPYNFLDNDQAQGIAVDLLALMLERVGSSQGRQDIIFTSWSRAYGLTQRQPYSLLFSTTRTETRENKFKWVGPIDSNTTELFARKDKKIEIISTADLQHYRVGTIIDDVGEQLLKGKGYPLAKMVRVVNRNQVQHLLHTGRVDLSADNKLGFLNYCKAAGYNPDDYASVYTLNNAPIAYAFHPDTPDNIIKTLQQALDDIKADGRYQKILKRYGSY